MTITPLVGTKASSNSHQPGPDCGSATFPNTRFNVFASLVKAGGTLTDVKLKLSLQLIQKSEEGDLYSVFAAIFGWRQSRTGGYSSGLVAFANYSYVR
ncbi:MAG: hypothetical protein WB662_15735 [Methyloceanibacter sp.]